MYKKIVVNFCNNVLGYTNDFGIHNEHFKLQWSYGVVLWEIYTFGGHPYEGVQNRDIKHHLLEGNRLDKPPLVLDEL